MSRYRNCYLTDQERLVVNRELFRNLRYPKVYVRLLRCGQHYGYRPQPLRKAIPILAQHTRGEAGE